MCTCHKQGLALGYKAFLVKRASRIHSFKFKSNIVTGDGQQFYNVHFYHFCIVNKDKHNIISKKFHDPRQCQYRYEHTDITLENPPDAPSVIT